MCFLFGPEEQELELKRLNVLIGPNGSGQVKPYRDHRIAKVRSRQFSQDYSQQRRNRKLGVARRIEDESL